MKRNCQNHARKVKKHFCDSSVPCSMSSDTTKDNHWDTHKLYQCNYNPFHIEYVKIFNPLEGRDQIVFLYKDKENGKIIKYRILR